MASRRRRADPDKLERDRRLNPLYATVLAQAKHSLGANNSSLLEVVTDWNEAVRKRFKHECLGWDKYTAHRFRRLCQEVSGKLRQLAPTSSPQDVKNALIPLAELVTALYDPNRPIDPISHTSRLRPVRPPSSTVVYPRSPHDAPTSASQHPHHSGEEQSFPPSLPTFSPSLHSFSPAIPFTPLTPGTYDSDGEEVLDSNPLPLSRQHSVERSLAKAPEVTDRTARQYGYGSARHWRAVMGW